MMKCVDGFFSSPTTSAQPEILKIIHCFFESSKISVKLSLTIKVTLIQSQIRLYSAPEIASGAANVTARFLSELR
jgi:hypothetical protein